MSTYSNRLQPARQNLLRVVRFFHPRSSCTMTHILADVQRITLNASCVMISGRRTKQLDIFCHVTSLTSDFLSFIVVEHIRFLHGALQLCLDSVSGQQQQKQTHVFINDWFPTFFTVPPPLIFLCSSQPVIQRYL